jgi:hypothetical protein
MPTPTITTIQPQECIGNSLGTINLNFLNLESSAIANDALLTTLNSSINALTTQILELSGKTIPGIAKAWVKFNGRTIDTDNSIDNLSLTNRFIYSFYNISTVYRKGVGDYRVNFLTPFANTNYTVVGTSNEKVGLGGLYGWFQPYGFTTTYVDVKIHTNTVTDLIDPEHISLVIY